MINIRGKKLIFLDKLLAFFLLLIAFLFKSRNKVNKFPRKVKSILVIKLSAFGDALCMIPSIKKLQLEFDDINIDWLTTKKTNADFFDNLGIFQKIYIMSFSNGFFSIFDILLKVRKNKYDLIIDFDQKYLISEAISQFGDDSIGFKTSYKGFHHSYTVEYDPIANERLVFLSLVECYFKLQSLPYTQPQNQFIIDFGDLTSKTNNNFLNSLPDDLVIIYPGSGLASSLRLWSIDNYKKLIEKIIELGYSVAVIGGYDEVRFSKSFNFQTLQYHDLINKLSLFDLTELLRKKCKVFIGNDGGLMHLANAVNAKIVAIYGPSLYSKWGPLGSNANEISVELPCRPCIKGYQNQIPNSCEIISHSCIKNITVKRVLNEFNRIKE